MGQAQHFRPIISFNSSPQSSDVVSVAIIIIIFHFTDKDIEVEKQRLGIYPNLTARGWSFAQSLLAKSLGITPKVRVKFFPPPLPHPLTLSASLFSTLFTLLPQSLPLQDLVTVLRISSKSQAKPREIDIQEAPGRQDFRVWCRT